MLVCVVCLRSPVGSRGRRLVVGGSRGVVGAQEEELIE